MKRTLSGLVLVCVLALLLIPFLALGQPHPPQSSVPSPPHSPPTAQAAAAAAGPPWKIENPLNAENIPELINDLVNVAFWLAIIIAPLMILWGAFTFMTAAGSPEKVATGKKIIFWAIVGLAIILFSRGIISIIKTILSG